MAPSIALAIACEMRRDCAPSNRARTGASNRIFPWSAMSTVVVTSVAVSDAAATDVF
jgi:hypothetical protein